MGEVTHDRVTLTTCARVTKTIIRKLHVFVRERCGYVACDDNFSSISLSLSLSASNGCVICMIMGGHIIMRTSFMVLAPSTKVLSANFRVIGPSPYSCLAIRESFLPKCYIFFVNLRKF